jgi:hypothetical protein
MSLKKIVSHPYFFWVVLAIIHICVLTALYIKFGFNTVNEGDKYLTRATYLAHGDFINSTQYQTFYVSYVVYLAFFVFIKAPTLLIFMSTYSLSLLAYYKFHKLISSYINYETSRLWLVLICLSPLIQYWQFNLFSETFFIAVSLLFAYVSLFDYIKYRSVKISILAFIVIFSRPSGIFTVMCVLLFKLYQDKRFTKKQILILGSFTLLILFIGISFFFQLPYHDFSKYISNGSIYYGFPSWTSPELPPGNYTLFNCYQFIVHQKGVTTLFSLLIQKFNSFFLTTRPYYSNFHNLINLCHHLFYTFVLLALFFSYKKQKQIYTFLISFLTIILLNALMISLIFNEWSERHTLHVFPYVLLLASYSIVHIWHPFVKKQRAKLLK